MLYFLGFGVNNLDLHVRCEHAMKLFAFYNLRINCLKELRVFLDFIAACMLLDEVIAMELRHCVHSLCRGVLVQYFWCVSEHIYKPIYMLDMLPHEYIPSVSGRMHSMC